MKNDRTSRVRRFIGIPTVVVIGFTAGIVLSSPASTNEKPLDPMGELAAQFSSVDAQLRERGLGLAVGPMGVRAGDLDLLDFEEMVQASDAIVVGSVTKVGPHTWNSNSGERFEERLDGEGLTRPAQYRMVSVDVERVVGGTANESLEFLTWQSADPVGSDLYFGLSDGPILLDRAEGTFDPGAEYLLFLKRDEIVLEGGDVLEAYTLTSSFRSQFQLVGGKAVSLEPTRTADDAERLIQVSEAIASPDLRLSAGDLTWVRGLDAGAIPDATATSARTDVRLVFGDDGDARCDGSACGDRLVEEPSRLEMEP